MVGCQLSVVSFSVVSSQLAVAGKPECLFKEFFFTFKFKVTGVKYLLLTTDNRPLTTKMVPRARLELACLSTLVPKTSASTNFATSA